MPFNASSLALWFRVYGLGFRVQGFRFRGLGFRFSYRFSVGNNGILYTYIYTHIFPYSLLRTSKFAGTHGIWGV